MAIERTLTIIKPDSVAAEKVGEIIVTIENAGFRILAMKKLHLSRSDAEAFYQVHQEKPFVHLIILIIV